MEKKVSNLRFQNVLALFGAILSTNLSTSGQEPQQTQDVRTREIWDSSLL
jgi:hypothetical protein